MELHDMCYVCFCNNDLVPCKQCVYTICKGCILNEKMSIARTTVCEHKECNDGKEGVCERASVDFVYTCGTCKFYSKIQMNDLIDVLTTLTVSAPTRTLKRPILGVGLSLLFFTIHDLDSGRFELVKSWND